MEKNKVRVRFAPSPTGFLHIGGARTALYNWLFAQKKGGSFILRIEDTDRTRFVPEALDDITSSLKWLGLEWDEGPSVGGPVGPYFQSERVNTYREFAEQLVKEGKAYYCFCTADRLQELRRAQAGGNASSGYDRCCRSLTPEQVQAYRAAGKTPVIRFKAPEEGKVEVTDALRGKMSFDLSTLDDFVLLKSDGFPTYHLANVVDDHLMQITHVMRGDEWLVSTPKHILLYQAWGWTPPCFIHLPVFLAPDGKGKLSKRHGATSVIDYKEKGYLPEALVNFLLLLGWHPADDQEFFTLQEAAETFSMERINTSPVAFSLEKLDWFNGMYIRKLAPRELAERCLPFLQKEDLLPDPCSIEQYDYLVKIIPLIQERINLLTEAGPALSYFLKKEIDPPSAELLVPKKSTLQTTCLALEQALKALKETTDYSEAALEETLRNLAKTLEIKVGQLFMPLRVAVTGSTATPGLFEVLTAIGKERVLARIEAAIKVLQF